MRQSYQWARIAIGFALGATILSTPAPSFAQEQRCFDETGQCISGRFLSFWQENGGLPVFGYPISKAQNQVNRDTGKTYLTQMFERNRFELHPENQAPYDVLLGRLGDDSLHQQNIDWNTLPKGSVTQGNCIWFEQTQHSICDQEHAAGFKSYWLGHGLNDPALSHFAQSLALFGMPLSEPTVQTNSSGDTVLTQIFERARFEWHPNKPQEYRVLLGLLGNEQLRIPSDPSIPRDWETRWLKATACQSPCWEGVTPGKTTAGEARDIWGESALIDGVSESSTKGPNSTPYLQWSWKSDGSFGGTANYGKDNIITSIQPLYPSLLRLQQITDAFGSPSSVVATTSQRADGTTIYRLTLIYLAKGFSISAIGEPASVPSFSATMSVSAPLFFVPSQEGFLNADGQSSAKQIVPWQGFQDFAFYCRTSEGQSCQ